ncbi:hypothetical protein [Legionella clemsonensis]|nr:hypothetical protein [Legionella clemsonensis]
MATMLVLSLLSLLILSGLQTIFLYYQSSNQRAAKKEAFYDLEFYAQQLLSKQLAGKKYCLVPGQEANKIIQLVKAKGCSFRTNRQTYRYLLEELEPFPCLQTFKNKRRYSTKHWRITLLTKAPNKMFLQIRIARAVPLITCPLNRINYIPLGVLSWRYLTEF